MVSDLNMSHGEMFNFVSFAFGLTLVIKLRNFDFKGDKEMMSDLIMPYQTVSDLV